MSIFDGTRLKPEQLNLDLPRLQQGWYADFYFNNIIAILDGLQAHAPHFTGHSWRLEQQGLTPTQVAELEIGNLAVEMQWFTRRVPFSVVAGVDVALAMLAGATGYHDATGQFVNTYAQYSVEAVQDGVKASYNGNPLAVQPVLKVRGRYRDVALLETTTLGVLSRASRIATNVYHTLRAARGKPVLFFPARFDAPEVQALDGYAYWIGVQRYNHDTQQQVQPSVSTPAQAAWWGGKASGTLAHAGIAVFLGDTVAVMLAFAATRPPEIPRVALVDFDNDCIGTTLAVMDAMFARYRELTDAGHAAEAERYRLYAVRPDTSGNLRDVSVPPLGERMLDNGVNPRLIFLLREAINTAWLRWELPAGWLDVAREWCRRIQIVVTGGFSAEKIQRFEELGVPVDIYGVGSSLFSNSNLEGTNNDFTADVVRVQVAGRWYDLAKIGRQACANPDLELIQHGHDRSERSG